MRFSAIDLLTVFAQGFFFGGVAYKNSGKDGWAIFLGIAIVISLTCKLADFIYLYRKHSKSTKDSQ